MSDEQERTIRLQHNYYRPDAAPAVKVITVPTDARLRWEPNQHTLIVKTAKGEDLAAFYGVKWFLDSSLVKVTTETLPLSEST